jgi:phosphatidylinositol 4-kinase
MYYQMAFKQERVSVWLHTYRILSTSKTTGIIQLIPNAISIDGLKKEAAYPGSLRAYFENTYGASFAPSQRHECPALQSALTEFVHSMAGYSVICYLLAIKDRYCTVSIQFIQPCFSSSSCRHNGNIMIDTAGHVIHIDFGFVFGLGNV